MKTGKPVGSYADDPPTVPERNFARAPAGLCEPGGEGRLRPDLREVAKKHRPVFALAQAARWMAKTDGHGDTGRAMASLAVTGRRAAAELKDVEAAGSLRDKVLVELGPNATSKEKKHVDAAIAHARAVRGWIEAPVADRDRHFKIVRALYPSGPGIERPWIGVSGEDDLPKRPINIGRGSRTEANLTVTCPSPSVVNGKIVVDVRWASSTDLDDPQGPPIVVCLHGLGSRLEETDALSAALAAHGYGTVALDLPNHGYSERIPFDRLTVPMRDTGTKDGAAYALDLMEAFVDAFVKTLIGRHPASKDRFVAVAGGSLGGSLAMRFGRRAPAWLERTISWSPGNAWKSFWYSDNFHLAAVSADAVGTQPIERVAEPESPGSRKGYIHFAFDEMLPTTNHPYWHTWWRSGDGDDYVKAREVHAQDARTLRHEVYDEWHRRWACALAHDQLAVTMRGGGDEGAPAGKWPFDKIKIPLLLMAGSYDNFPFANIFDASQTLAKRAAAGTPKGVAKFFANTGHSIHDERPRMLARNIAAFLDAPGQFG